ncbi:MAG: hypothetical protein IKV21_01160 [Clostridia bacterium]|nr:hypothetical protein [Clostridia bacterium]
MKKKSEPMATFMAFTTLVIVGASARHCMKKYSGGGGRRRMKILFRR